MHEEVTAARGRPEEAEVQGEAARPEEAEVQRETATAGKIAGTAGSHADEAVNILSRGVSLTGCSLSMLEEGEEQ